jgi:hypothetical protein
VFYRQNKNQYTFFYPDKNFYKSFVNFFGNYNILREKFEDTRLSELNKIMLYFENFGSWSINQPA